MDGWGAKRKAFLISCRKERLEKRLNHAYVILPVLNSEIDGSLPCQLNTFLNSHLARKDLSSGRHAW